MLLYQRSSALFEQAKEYIPGGVNSPVRAFKSVGGTPVYMQSARGAELTDVDGKIYLDYICSWGPTILGHRHPDIVDAIKKQADLGLTYGTPTERETEIARLIIKMNPMVEQVRMVNSGTEACMSAVRLARGYTSRAKIIKFEGCYHGHADAFLIKAGSGAMTFGSPDSAGVTQGVAQDTLLATYNDLESVRSLFEANKETIAGVIIEPVTGNTGCIRPTDDFMQGLRELCTEYGSLLIFDEVMTGFRLAVGGAQELLQVEADIVCYGKVIGGGLPVGAFASTREIMSRLSPLGAVYQAGTLSGNPLAMAAGYAQLTYLDENQSVYSSLERKTKTLADGLAEILQQHSVPHVITRVGSMMTVFFTELEAVSDFEDAKTANNATFRTFFHQMLAQGVYLPPSSFEAWFLSDALTEDHIEQTLAAARKVDFSKV